MTTNISPWRRGAVLCISVIDQLSRWLGRIAAVCSILMATATGLVVLWRYAFNGGSLALQESINYLYAGVFMLGAAYTLRQQGHVRVDIFYRRFTPRTRAWIDSVGTIVFLLPLTAAIGLFSQEYVEAAWTIKETSPDPGGLPVVYLLKLLIPVMAATLFIQGCAELLRNLLLLSESNAPPDTPT